MKELLTILALPILMTIFVWSCTQGIPERPLMEDYKYWRPANIDFDGTFNAYDDWWDHNEDYSGARRAEPPTDDPLDVVCFMQDTIYLVVDGAITVVSINNDYHDDRIYYDDQWWPPTLSATVYSTWFIPAEVTDICTDYLCFTWNVNGPFDCDGLGLPIGVTDFYYETVGDDYLFTIEVAWEENADIILVQGSNDPLDDESWVTVCEVDADNLGTYKLTYKR